MTSLVAEPPNRVLFFARRDSLRLTMTARYATRDPVSGQPTGQTPGKFVAFRDFRFEVPPTGEVTIVDSTIEAAEVVEWLKRHRLFGDREEGFWLYEEPAPAITAAEQQRVSDAALEHDVATLEEMLAQERAGWAREEFVANLTDTIRKIRELQDRMGVTDAAKTRRKPQA
jgi:hypothetical protein